MQQVEIYLHAGIGKTGTSALQGFLAENASHLQEFGILYPSAHRSMDDGGAHHALAIAMMRNPPAWAPVGARVPPEQMLADMIDEAVPLGLSKLVVSTELLYVISPQKVRDLVRGFRAKIVLYVRRQDVHAMSMTNQAIKATGEYCDATTVSCDAASWDMLLRTVVEWMEVFPPSDLIFRPYERQQFVSGDLFADFLSILGVPTTDGFQRTQGQMNQSLGRDALEYMNQVNAVVNDVAFTRAIGELLVGYGESERGGEAWRWSLLSPPERLAVIARFAELNARIAGTYLARGDGRLFHDPLPSVYDEWKPYPGLSRERAEEITAWLHHRWPSLVDALAGRLRLPVRRVGIAANQAMSVLAPAVEQVCGQKAA